MRVRQLSPTGDFVFGGGQSDFLVNSPEAVAQVIETTLRLWLGEWFLNLNAGTPWLEGVLGYNSQTEADQTLIQTVSNVSNGSQLLVQSLYDWNSEIDPKTRAYTSITAKVNTIYGMTSIQIENVGAL